MLSSVLFSSASVEWATPQLLFEQLNGEFHFTLDVCATAANAKCDRFYDLEADGLKQPWDATWWCNPPYGRQLGEWTTKAATSLIVNQVTGVMLVPARTDTRWFHEDILPIAAEIRFLRGRLHFGGAPSPAPFPSMLVVYRPQRVVARLAAMELTKEQRGC